MIHAGRLIDGVSDKVNRSVSIVIEGDRIQSLKCDYIAVDPNDELIGLKKYTVLPGLMDMHTHLSTEFSKNEYIKQFQLNPADYALQAAVYARRTLMAGEWVANKAEIPDYLYFPTATQCPDRLIHNPVAMIRLLGPAISGHRSSGPHRPAPPALSAGIAG